MPRYRRRNPEQFAIPIAKKSGPPPGPEVLPWYWHPNRDGAGKPPDSFAAQLKAINPDLAATFNPVQERWQIWVKSPRIQSELCRGWNLLFFWEHPTTKAFLPLSELVFHNLMLIDAEKYAGAKQYYDRIQSGVDAAREARQKQYDTNRQDEQAQLSDMFKISSAAPGNRAALHHDGTVEPSAGHRHMLSERRKWRLPSEMIQQEKDDKEKGFYGR